MSVTYASLIAAYPALSSINEGLINTAIDTAEDMISEDFFEDKYDRALSLLAAHLATSLNQGSSSTGSVISEKIGELETRFAALASDADELESTNYGRQFKTLRAQFLLTPILNEYTE